MTDVIDIATRRRAQARGPWFRIEAAADSAEIFIYNDIGKDFFGEGISAEDLVQELAKLKVKTLHVRINSNGGSVFDGLAIYNALDRHPARVITHVDGIAASIASVIAVVGDEVRIAKNAFLMIHNPHGMALGNADDMRTMAETLDTVADSMVGIYREATGKSTEKVQEWMDAETWFNAADAKAAGLVDEITNDQAIAACFDLSGFRHAPADVAALVTSPPTVSADAPTQEQLEDFWWERRRLKEMAASIRK
jgi:ATP-dependent Clp endopeptidase proteolytic subunit ClpP